MIMLPKEILDIVKGMDYKENNIGRAEDKVIIFENKYVLKISNDIDRLLREKEKIDWLSDKIVSSRSIKLIIDNNTAYYLRTCLDGVSLVDARFMNDPNLLIKMIAKAINKLKELNKYNFPFNSLDNSGFSFVHGDLCLPNILVLDNADVAFIDLDNCGIGDPWYDYSWVLWSLEYNLKSNKYNKLLLDELGIEFDEDKYNFYIPVEYRFNRK